MRKLTRNHLTIFQHNSYRDRHTSPIFDAMTLRLRRKHFDLDPTTDDHNDGFIVLKSTPTESFL